MESFNIIWGVLELSQLFVVFHISSDDTMTSEREKNV